MRPLTIFIDLDDTTHDLLREWIIYLDIKYGTTVSYWDVNDWDLSMAFPSLTAQEVYAPLKDIELWKKVKPLWLAPEIISRLRDDGHKVVIVTASDIDIVGAKLRYTLFKYLPWITKDDVVVTSQKQLLRGDIMVDDAPQNLINGTYHGILMTAPHNRDFNTERYGLSRAGNWCEVYKIICDYADRKERDKH